MTKIARKEPGASRSVDARRGTRSKRRSALSRRPLRKFDETVDLAVRLGVNPKHATRWCAAPSSCRTEPVRSCASWCSPRGTRNARPPLRPDLSGADELVQKDRGFMSSTG